MAMAEVRLTLAALLSKYEVLHAPETDWKFGEVYIGTIRPTQVQVLLKAI